MFKSIITLAVMVASLNSFAFEIHSYKSTGSKLSKINETSFNEAWTKKAVCVKDGAKILGVNKAFKEAKFGYRDCSNSDATLEKHRLVGVETVVLKVVELPDSIAKKFLGLK